MKFNLVNKLSASVFTLVFSLAIVIVAVSSVMAAQQPYSWNEGDAEHDAALNLTPNLENGMVVYEVCSSCHLPEGWGTKEGTFPQLAGQHRTVIIKQLADIRALNRDNPTMYPFALPESIGGVQAIADVAAYIETLKMNPEHGMGPDSADLVKGKKLYQDNCVKCHGEKGEGDAEKFYPRIQGQHYAYMLRQFEWIRDGKRRNSNPKMVKQIQNFTQEDMINVISYVATIPVDEKIVAPSKSYTNPHFE
jgi:cytochrome c553